jgi:hypothetical protein
MTLDIYADLFDEDLDSVADPLDAAIQATADALRTVTEAYLTARPLNCSNSVELRGFEPLP